MIFFSSGLIYRAPKALYEEANQNQEKWGKIVHLAVAKGTVVASILPKFISSLVAYFATDLGGEAFVLPIPMWLVGCKAQNL